MTTKTKTALEDIRDVEGFAAAVVYRSLGKRGMLRHELEEAVTEGVAIIYALHKEAWKRELCESFYTYCTRYVELRLIDWWRRDQRQRNLSHRRGDWKTASDGERYIYHGRVSLEELSHDVAHHDDADPASMPGSSLPPLLRQALNFVPTARREETAQVITYSQSGFRKMEIAKRLAVSWRRVSDIEEELRGAVVKALRADGYSDAECIRYLAVPTGVVMGTWRA